MRAAAGWAGRCYLQHCLIASRDNRWFHDGASERACGLAALPGLNMSKEKAIHKHEAICPLPSCGIWSIMNRDELQTRTGESARVRGNIIACHNDQFSIQSVKAALTSNSKPTIKAALRLQAKWTKVWRCTSWSLAELHHCRTAQKWTSFFTEEWLEWTSFFTDGRMARVSQYVFNSHFPVCSQSAPVVRL